MLFLKETNFLSTHDMTCHGIWYELKLKTLTQKQKDLLGIKLSSQNGFKYLSKTIRKIKTDYPWSVPPNAVLAGLAVSDNFVHELKWLYPNVKHIHSLLM